jgi:uncharacterized protein
MLSGSVIDINKHDCLLSDVKKTNNIFERMRGLLFRSKLKPKQALWIEPCPSIHTIGMKYSIDVVFLDEKGIVLKVVNNIAPMRMATCKGARVSLELLAGEAEKAQIQTGMQLNWNKKENN